MRIAGGFLFTAGWCAYLGGALVMELVWRPVQVHIPPSQTGVLCQHMGRVYKRLALLALAVIVAGLVMVRGAGPPLTDSPIPPSGHLSLLHGTDLALLVGLAVLALLVGGMAVFLHPLSHARWPVASPDEQRNAQRRRRHTAIKVMGVLLRIELALALCLGVVAVFPATTGSTR